MIQIPITPQMLRKAQKKASELGTLKNSITKGKGNLAGFLGEEIVKTYLSAKSSNTKDYDLSYKKKKYDVKTKLTTKPPLPEYDCSIAAYNTVQKCDSYIFVRIQKDKDDNLICGWILGWMDKEEYFKNAEYWPKGKIDPANGYRVKANCYNVKISELNSIERLL